MAIAEPEANPTAKALLRARARTRFNQSMRLVRRAHLYAGLFMTPWVFLYGVTAMLFNHPLVFPDIEQKNHSIAPADLAGTPLASFPTPQALAGQVVAAINATAGTTSASSYQLVDPEAAAFARDYFTTVAGGSTDHTVRLDLATGIGSIRTAPSRKDAERETPPPFARRPIKLESAPMEDITKSVSMLLTRFDLPQLPEAPGQSDDPAPRDEAGEPRRKGRRDEQRRGPTEQPETSVRRGEREPAARPDSEPTRPRGREEAGRRKSEGQETVAPAFPSAGGGRGGRRGAPTGPELNFKMKGDGKIWRVGYNLQTGTITGRPDDGSQTGESLSNRRFLLRLHTAHGYPAQLNARWIWAVAVDVMFVCMVGWGITGLLMWWQMKNVRRVGVVLLVLSALVSVAVAIGMHGMMVGGS